MDNNFDLIIKTIANLPREEFRQFMGKLPDDVLDYWLREMKSYRERYPYPLYQIMHFN